MVENLYDKDGNQIEDVYDAEGNPIDETLTPEEVEAKIQEAREEAKGEFETEIQEKEEALEEKEYALRTAQEELDKEKEKDKNFGKLRGSTKEKEERVEKLEEQIAGLSTELKTFREGTQKNVVRTTAEKMAKGDNEMADKIEHFYNQFVVPEEDNEEKRKERWQHAVQLATGSPEIPSGAFATGGGSVPGEPKDQGKLSEGGVEVAKQMGLDEKELRRNKLL